MKIKILIFAILLAGCQFKKDDHWAHQNIPSTEVTLTSVKEGSISSTLTLSATTVYQRKTTLATPIACYITQALVSPGDMVRKGQTLFILESKENRALGDESRIGKLSIKASCSGLITDVMQQTGSYTPEGTPLCIIAELSSMVFELNVPYEQQRNIHQGAKCKIVLPDENVLYATLEKPLLSVDGQSQTGHYIAKAKHPFLPEGLMVQVLIHTGSYNSSHQILPKEAVQCDETMTDYWVMEMEADSLAVKVPVRIGNSNSRDIEIISPVFSSSDKIISSGSYGLTEGSPVKVVKR